MILKRKKKKPGSGRCFMRSRPCALFHAERFAQEAVEEAGCSSLCYIPRSFFWRQWQPSILLRWKNFRIFREWVQAKAKRYGQEFCVLIKKHCEENEIERPEDLRVRTVANKSKLKVSIIQAIDRKVALDDIAVSKGLEFSELLDEVEAIVYSGTKLNIDYFLEEIMDEDHLDDIYDYFKESTTDKIDDAMEELGDDYTEDEIRLVRIKFISEMAN